MIENNARVETDSLEYSVVASGSSGNAVIIEDILVDCGIAYSKLKDYLYDIRYLLLTHIHTDHIKSSCYNKIRKEFPHIQVIGNYEIAQKYGVDIISNSDYPVETEHYIFNPFDCIHDVVTQGFAWESGEDKIIYATDTSSLEKAPEDKYDYLFLEANYCPAKLEQIRGKKKGSYDPYVNALRHMSKKDTQTFYYLNRRNRDSKLIELHQSSRFY